MSEFLLIGDALRRNAYKYSVKVVAREGGKGEVEADARREIKLSLGEYWMKDFLMSGER